MNMIHLDIQFHHFRFLIVQKGSNASRCSLRWVPLELGYQYFGTQTIGYWQCQIVCDHFLNRLMGYYYGLLSPQQIDRSTFHESIQPAKPLISDHALRAWFSTLLINHGLDCRVARRVS